VRTKGKGKAPSKPPLASAGVKKTTGGNKSTGAPTKKGTTGKRPAVAARKAAQLDVLGKLSGAQAKAVAKKARHRTRDGKQKNR
jgi:hypothetical protein